MFFAWIFVVFPALHFGIDIRKETISSATFKDDGVNTIIGFGLVAGALSQIVFLSYIVQKFFINYISVGCILYLTANLATILVAFFTYKKHPLIHKLLTRYYFFIMPTSLIFIGSYIKNTGGYVLFFFSLLVLILYSIGQLFLFKKYRGSNSLMEFWAFGILSIWTLVITFI